MNKKGFTLVELIATVAVLALVMSIGTMSIIGIIKNSKEKNYNYLLDNIKSSVETYYQECKYANSNNSGITCNIQNNSFQTTLGDLVKYGYLKGNDTDKSTKKITLVNPINDENISNCKIKVEFTNGQIKVTTVGTNSENCPTNAEYSSGKMDAGRL